MQVDWTSADGKCKVVAGTRYPDRESVVRVLAQVARDTAERLIQLGTAFEIKVDKLAETSRT